ncbi:MAG TPA: ABC transporter permease [Dongiaceae bacterium]|nr:ABC transporter permease [Dongiaceae bacterium]
MLKLIGQRLVLGLVTLLLASALIFFTTTLLPGDFASAMLGQQATAENTAAIRAELGLDRPLLQRYTDWLSGAARGDFGNSLASHRPVMEEIRPRLANTFFLALYAALVAVPLSVFLGIMAAIRQGSVFDRGVNVSALLTISVPEFFLGYLLLMFLAAHLRIFPVLSVVNPSMPFFTRLYVTFLPMITLVLVIVAHMMRMTRASVLQVMASPYIEMAYLKGLPKWRVVVQHALPNALAPIVNVIALNLAYLVVGVVVVERVFVYPGMGQMLVDAVSKRNIPTVLACGLIFAVVFIALNILADVLSIMSNPRLRHPR